MANRSGHRRFGNVRKLPSGRYQARYLGPDGRMRTAPDTFARKSDAERYLTLAEAQLTEFAERWIDQRPRLRPRTVELYRWLLRKYVSPYIGGVPLARLDPATVREWRAVLLDLGVSESMAAKAYRLLRTVLMTAVKEDEILSKNPCRIPGADQEKPSERPVLSVPQVLQLAGRMPARYRALVLVATFGCLRWGEVSALQRQDLDVDAGAVRVRQAFTEQRGVGLVLGPPKSRAGRRRVSLPAVILRAIRTHLATYVRADPDAFVFTGPASAPIWRGNLNKLLRWRETVADLGMPGLHFHDLRHTGNTLAACTGASLRDLMARMGHDSADAAMIYQHATSAADRAIADAVDRAVRAAETEDDEDPEDGAAGVLARRR